MNDVTNYKRQTIEVANFHVNKFKPWIIMLVAMMNTCQMARCKLLRIWNLGCMNILKEPMACMNNQTISRFTTIQKNHNNIALVTVFSRHELQTNQTWNATSLRTWRSTPSNDFWFMLQSSWSGTATEYTCCTGMVGSIQNQKEI